MLNLGTHRISRARGLASLTAALILVSACVGGGGGGGDGSNAGGSDPLEACGLEAPGAASTAPSPASGGDSPASPPSATDAGGSGSDDLPTGSDETCVGADDEAVTGREHSGTDGRNNIIRAINRQDDTLLVRGSIQLNSITGDTIRPSNQAWSVGYGCSSCNTFAVALQVNLIGDHANTVSPENVAVALNYACTDCVTVARALQYTMTVDDPTDVPNDVRQLIQEMEHELRRIDNEHDVTLEEAESRVNDIIARFEQLAESLDDQRDEERAATSSPLPESSGDAAATPTDGAVTTTQPVGSPAATRTPTDGAATPSPSPSSTLAP